MTKTFEMTKGQNRYVFTVQPEGVRIEAFIGTLRTRQFTTDLQDARERWQKLRADGFVQR